MISWIFRLRVSSGLGFIISLGSLYIVSESALGFSKLPGAELEDLNICECWTSV